MKFPFSRQSPRTFLRALRVSFVPFVVSFSLSAQQDVTDVAQRVDTYYNSLKSMKAEFTETYRGAGLQRTEAGTLWLKHPGKMRWDYRQPQEKLFLTDGKTAWLYLPADRQARRAPIKHLDDLRSPLRFLLGRTKLKKELNGLSFAPDVKPLRAGNVVLRGVPKGMEDRIEQVLLEVTPAGQIERLTILELDGSSTEFRFSAHEPNVAIADNRFRFTAPPGVEVVEMREIAP